MAVKLSINDPFYLTFGKQNWQQNQRSDSKKKSQNGPWFQQENRNLKKEINVKNKKDKEGASARIIKKNKDKSNTNMPQSLMFRSNTQRKTSKKTSIFDNEDNKTSNFLTIKQQVQKRIKKVDILHQRKKQQAAYDFLLSQKLNNIGTLRKQIGDCHKITSYYQVYKQSKYLKPTYQLQKIQNLESKKLPRKLQVQCSTKYKYKEEMKKIDNLIEKVNERLSHSTRKFS